MRLLLICLLFSSLGIAQNYPIEPFWAENNLSQQHINCQLKDSQGFLWIGTQDGLNRFDAYRFQTFWHQETDSLSLSNHFIWCMLEDEQDDLWIGTFGGGLNRFDPQTESFQHYYPGGPENAQAADHSIRSLAQGSDGLLWVGTDRGFWEFELDREVFRPRDTLLNAGLTAVSAFYPLSSRWLLLAATEGLFLVDRQNRTKSRMGTEYSFSTAMDILALQKEIWVAGSPGVLRLQYYPEKDTVEVLAHHQALPNALENRLANASTQLLLDDYQTLWVGTLGSLFTLDPANPEGPWQEQTGLPDLQVNSLFQLEPGLLAIGTRQGLSVAATPPPAFDLYDLEVVPELCSPVILGMDQAADGTWWIGTKEGLFTCDANWKNGQCLTPANTQGMPVPYIINVQVIDQEVWATFWRGGLGKIEPTNSGWRVDTIPGLTKLTRGAGIHDLLKDPTGRYWIATPNIGVVRWDPKTGELSNFTAIAGDSTTLTSPYIFHLLLDQNQQLWMGSANGGLCRMNLEGEQIECYMHQKGNPRSISNNLVLSTFEDSQGRIWACTAGGLNLWQKDGSFRQFTKQEGLPNEVVYGMLEDTLGNLWISTNGGLCRMHQQDGTWHFQQYTVDDGLQGNEFNQYSFLALRDGQLCFGGPQGLNCFQPERVQPSDYLPPLALTNFLLFNEPQEPQNNPLLESIINLQPSLTLAHHQNYLGFEFAALGFQQASNQQYAYRLLGLETQWVQAGNRRFASYPNLAPGKYTFQVKAANHDGVWSEWPKSIDLWVRAPWWQRWWALLIWISLILLAIWSLVRLRENTVRRIERAKTQEREAFRKRTAQDFHDEAGNRITKLSLLTEVAKRQAMATSPILDQLEENTQALRTSMRDFIWVLDPTQDQLADMYLRLIETGNQLFEHSTARFQASPYPTELAPISLNGQQRRHLLMIFQEAMNNTVKYAQAKNAHLSIEVESQRCQIVFFDDGRGIDPGKKQGYGLQNMRERAQKMGGALHLSSRPEAGTRISLQWQITQVGD